MAFAEVFQQVRGDMMTVAGRLRQDRRRRRDGDRSRTTSSPRSEEMIEALKKAQAGQEERQSRASRGQAARRPTRS